jgi:hypothetical protein
MALDTTVGGYYATSFAEITEADDYIDAYDPDATWLDLEDSQKEFRLRVAAQFIGTLPLRGYKVYEYQTLCFPRSVQVDLTEVPEGVKEAQSLIAYLIIDKNIQESATSSEGGGQILDEPLIRSVEVMGVMRVGLQNTLDTRATKQSSPTVFARYLAAYAAPVWMLIKPYLTQIRGGVQPIIVGPEASTGIDYSGFYESRCRYPDYNRNYMPSLLEYHQLLASPDYVAE